MKNANNYNIKVRRHFINVYGNTIRRYIKKLNRGSNPHVFRARD
jgi:hypothetical protein